MTADEPLLLTVARVDPQEDQLAIVDLLAALPGAHAALAGPVTVPGYDAEIVARAHLLGVAGRLHLLGSWSRRAPSSPICIAPPTSSCCPRVTNRSASWC